MKHFAYALATAAALSFAVPAYALDTAAPVRLAQADMKVKSGEGASVKKKVVIKKKSAEPNKKVVIKKTRHDNGRHVGFSHSKHYGYAMAKKKTIIKKHS